MTQSKTVHVHLSPECVVGCFDAIEMVAQKSTEGRSVAEVVAWALEGFIATQRRRGMIQQLEPDEALRRLALIEHARDRVRSDLPTFDVPSNDDIKPQPPPTVETSTVQRAMDAMSVSGTTVGVQHNPNPEPPPPPPTAKRDEIVKTERMSLSEIANLSVQEDEVLSRAEHEGGDWQLAVEVVYSKIPRSMWGSGNAANLVERLVEEMRGS